MEARGVAYIYLIKKNKNYTAAPVRSKGRAPNPPKGNRRHGACTQGGSFNDPITILFRFYIYIANTLNI